MKKTIKTGMSALLLVGTIHSFSQTSLPDELLKARIQLIEGTSQYNPLAALSTFTQKANQGNAEAMNALGLIYSKGMGVAVNDSLAVEWFEKAAQKGYGKAHYNLALLYKKGVSVPKDLTKALDYFQKAAQEGYIEAYSMWGTMVKDGLGTTQDYQQAMNIYKQGSVSGNAFCLYAQGYLHYKGFGAAQDYSKAITLFQQAADQGVVMGIYMLGYCYSNGYGVTIDAAKAKLWFTKAADLGLTRAKTELAQSATENARPNQPLTLSTKLAENVQSVAPEIPKKLPLLQQKINQENISGDYTGHLLRYDWSGQNVLSKTPIIVSFNQEGKHITGIWIEQEGDSIPIKADIDASEIAFKDTKIDRLNRYDNPVMKSYTFKNARLQIVENHDDIYIIGNLQLYNIKQHENEKPMYLILKRHKDDSTTPAEAVVTQLVVYPNPIPNQSFKLSFDLAEQTPITIKIYDLSGTLHHEQALNTMRTGPQEQLIAFGAPTGNYILNLYYNDQVLRTILIKK